jgi:glycosyltransferase involved in cell wall biosynthesis
MVVISVGTDRKIFEEGSAARARMVEYGKLCKELHIIIYTLKTSNFKAQKISDTVWIYPTQSKNKFRYPLDARRVFKQELKHVKADVITTQDPFETGIGGWLIARRAKLPLHVQIHTDFMSPYFKKESTLNRVRVIIAHWLLPKAQAIRAVSDRIKESLKKINANLPQKTIVLPIYTDIERFRHAPIIVDLHKQYSRFSHIILMASRLSAEKNIPTALEVMREVILKYPNVGMVIVGDGPEKRYLQALMLKYHLDRNVVFEPWQKDLASYYRTADVFLTTSRYEGYGLTLVEAAASGCPIVTSDVGVAQKIIEEGVTGFVCDGARPATFSKKLIEMVGDPALLNAMKQAAHQKAEQRVSESKETYLETYKNMLEKAASRQA